jgi:uncharacterized membrane protein YdjX (TVP38/TMEM64 family)
MRNPVSEKSERAPRLAIIASLGVAVALLIALGATLWWLLPRELPIGLDGTVAGIENWVRSLGSWGVAGSIALMVAHSFLPFPSEIIAVANGMVYGPVWGSVITWVGAMLGAVSAFALVRLFGRPLLVQLLPAHQLQKLADWSRDSGGLALLVARLIPAIAFNLVNYAAALAEVTWWTFIWSTGLGILPLTILLAVVGDRILALPMWIWLVVGGFVVFFGLMLKRLWRRKPPADKPSHD